MNHHVKRVTRTSEIREFTDQYHSYIKWADRPSRKMYYSLHEDDRMVGVFALASGFVRPKVIQDFLKQHKIAFNEVANNIVFCLAGQTDRNAGTKFLKLCRTDAKAWWKERYDDELKLMQTFVLPGRVESTLPRVGAVYKADNWLNLGITKGETLITRTLYTPEERAAHPNAEVRRFKNGEVKYIHREFSTTPQKIIFVRFV